MNPETLIYDTVRKIIPDRSDRTLFFAAVSQTSHELFFYSYIDGEPVQCYELAQQGRLDANELDTVFEAVAEIIRGSKKFVKDKNNIATIKVDRSGIRMDLEYVEKDAGMYKIKKEWKQRNL